MTSIFRLALNRGGRWARRSFVLSLLLGSGCCGWSPCYDAAPPPQEDPPKFDPCAPRCVPLDARPNPCAKSRCGRCES